MGHTTDFIGHLDITPPLNDAEVAYLTAFGGTRHCDRGGSPYDVSGNPRAPERDDLDIDRSNRTGEGKPQLYCQWVVCGTGCCISYDGVEKFYAPVEWMRWLIDHLLRPGARAAGLGHPMLVGFSFDHRVEGIIVGCRRDTRELFAITVDDNVVSKVVMRPGEPQPWELPQLAYQDAIDRDRAARSRRRADSPAALGL